MRRTILLLSLCLPLMAGKCPFEVQVSKEGENSDQCYDRCLEEYHKCIANGNTESACAIALYSCQGGCPIGE